MQKHATFKFRDKDELLLKAGELGFELPFRESIDNLFEPVKIGPKTLPNRMIIHPMEGFDSEADGAPGELTFRRYRRFASGGSSVLWFEATSVVPEGRSNPRQLYISKNNVGKYRELVEETRKVAYKNFGKKSEPLLLLQLTHSGRYSKPTGISTPIIAQHNPVLDKIQKLSEDYPLITDEELDNLQEKYLNAAKLAVEAGFDGIDIKACHCYLVSELLASFSRTKSRYGDSFENRTRFLLEITEKIQTNLPGIILAGRLNIYDGFSYPFGFGVNRKDYKKEDLTEPKTLVKMLIEKGLSILSISIGNPYYNPHLGRPYNLPVKGTSAPDEHPLSGVNRLIRLTGEMQKEFPKLPVVGAGYSWLKHFFPNVAAGVIGSGLATLVGQGRGALAYPNSVKDLIEYGAMDPDKTCTSCSGCTQKMRDGEPSGCVIRDREIYG